MLIYRFIGLLAQAGADLSVYRFIGLLAQAGADLSVYRFIGLSAQAGKNRPCHHAVYFCFVIYIKFQYIIYINISYSRYRKNYLYIYSIFGGFLLVDFRLPFLPDSNLSIIIISDLEIIIKYNIAKLY